MNRFVLRYMESGCSMEDMKKIISTMGTITVLDETPRMLLVEAGQGDIKALGGRGTGWLIAPERIVASLPTIPHLHKPDMG
jgi:hypothetical protein